jgi:hypothetical protein
MGILDSVVSVFDRSSGGAPATTSSSAVVTEVLSMRFLRV